LLSCLHLLSSKQVQISSHQRTPLRLLQLQPSISSSNTTPHHSVSAAALGWTSSRKASACPDPVKGSAQAWNFCRVQLRPFGLFPLCVRGCSRVTSSNHQQDALIGIGLRDLNQTSISSASRASKPLGSASQTLQDWFRTSG